MKKFVTLFACVVMASAPAQALVEAGVEVDSPQITVIDLDTKDGIDAAWMEGGYRARLFQYDLRPASVVDETYGDGRLDAFETRIGGAAWSAQSGFFAVRDLYLPSYTVTATPFTRVSVSVPFRLFSTIESEAPFGVEPPNSLASFELQLVAINNLRVDADSGEVLYDELAFARDYVGLESPYGTQPVLGARRIDDSLLVSFDNSSASDAVFAFRAELVTFGNTGSAVATVPEPTTQGLWLAGSALLLWRLRRRRALHRSVQGASPACSLPACAGSRAGPQAVPPTVRRSMRKVG
jgi:PEP-CTERM motif